MPSPAFINYLAIYPRPLTRRFSRRRSAASGLAGGPTGNVRGPRPGRRRRRRPGHQHRQFVQRPGLVDDGRRSTRHVLRQRSYRLDIERVLPRPLDPADRPPTHLALLDDPDTPADYGRRAARPRFLESQRLPKADAFGSATAGRVRPAYALPARVSALRRLRRAGGQKRRAAQPAVRPRHARTGGDEVPLPRMVVVAFLAKVQQPALPLETPTEGGTPSSGQPSSRIRRSIAGPAACDRS